MHGGMGYGLTLHECALQSEQDDPPDPGSQRSPAQRDSVWAEGELTNILTLLIGITPSQALSVSFKVQPAPS